MKKTAVLFSLLSSLMVITAVAQAENSVRLRAEIPFNFVVDNTSLPAGAYDFEITPSGATHGFAALLVQDRDGKQAAYLFVMRQSDRRVTPANLQFTKYGNSYFLSAIATVEYRASVTRCKAEQEILALYKGQPAAIGVLD